MKFTGNNILYTPQVSQATYLFDNIIISSTGLFHVGTTHKTLGITSSLDLSNTGWLFHFQNGRVLDPSGKFVSTYNTGTPFSLSGWLDFPSAYRYLQCGKILSRSPESCSISGVLRAISIYCPTGADSGSMSCDVQFYSTRIVSSGALNDYFVHANSTGYLYSSLGQYINSDSFQFYQSYESLLTGAPLIAYVDTESFPYLPVKVIYNDNDSSSQNNLLTFDYSYFTSYGEIVTEQTLQRTGLYNSGVAQLVDLSFSSSFSGLFGGRWSGNNFLYDDTENSNIFNYYLSLTDGKGNPYPTSGYFHVSIPSTGTMMTGEYITGFRLTASGEYLYRPLIAVTGYYYCTGIQQSITSLLFSSGCTGDLSVTFSSFNGVGTGASGTLKTTPVTFNGLYFGGNKVFRTVYDYETDTIGTGYTMAPRAIVNTGMYGPGCFDVPLASGYNQFWYAPFRTSGTLDVEAGWFTGIAMCETGIVGVGLTGYRVTGIDVYNIGTGYSNRRVPNMSFIRTGVDSLTANASGVFSTNTGTLNSISGWYVEAGIPGLPPIISGVFSGTIPLTSSNYMYVKIVTSGLAITVPITGRVLVSINNLTNQSITTAFTYSKYYNTGIYALKKKPSSTIIFSTENDLSFLLSQDELDTLYTDNGYTDNSWPFVLGDFSF